MGVRTVIAAVLTGTVVACAGVAGSEARPPSAERSMTHGKRNCAYPAHRLSTLRRFERLVGGRADCILVFNNAAPDWEGWEHPWFAQHPDPDLNWAKWKRAAPQKRRLIITQSLIPDELKGKAWRSAGARGRYRRHAREFARTLVRAGLGDSVIRLSHEANAVWNRDTVGRGTAREMRLWRLHWRHTVKAMRSVPGARLRFDFTVNANYRPIPLRRFYPGDDVVDIVGIDAYDAGVRRRRGRWHEIYNRRLGVRDVLRFAKAHRKPLSIPEWGIGPARSKDLFSGGDNPEYMRGIARVMRRNRTAYQAYFFNHEWAHQLPRSPKSLRVYRRYLRPGL